MNFLVYLSSPGDPLCYHCVHRRHVPGDVHSSCNSSKAAVAGNTHGIKHGWFLHPYNFDPIWLEKCTGFQTEDPSFTPDKFNWLDGKFPKFADGRRFEFVEIPAAELPWIVRSSNDRYHAKVPTKDTAEQLAKELNKKFP